MGSAVSIAAQQPVQWLWDSMEEDKGLQEVSGDGSSLTVGQEHMMYTRT